MAEHANAALIRKAYDAFSKGDLDTVRTVFADDILWHIPGRGPLAGDYKGTDEVFGFFGKLFETTGGTFKIDIHDVLANDEHAVVLVRESATRDSKSLDRREAHVWHVNGGKATEFWAFDEDLYAGDEFFS